MTDKQDTLIKAFSKISNQKGVQLDIIGDGPEHQRLQKLINELGLSHVVHLCSLKCPEEVSAALNEADCFVLSSTSETFGIVLIEAMAKGVPVISTACGGPDEFVNESNGLLVPVGNEQAMAQAMLHMITNSNQYNRDAIRKDCYSNFSQDAIAEKILSVYHQISSKK